MELFIVIVGLGSIIANILITALVVKLYTEYWKDVTIKRRYEGKKD
jgi:cytochrome b subunit of formate dehydrogenase